MTAPLGNASNVHNGIVQIGNVTNSYGGYFQSAGVAYSLTVPFIPDKLDLYNFTKYGTNTNTLQSVWFRDFPSTGGALNITRGTTTLSSSLSTTNGVIDVSTPGGFADEHRIITGISAGVVTTSTAHTLTTNDRVVITQVVGTVGPFLNNNTYVVQVLTSTTFRLFDVYGFAIVQAGTYTSGGQITKTGPDYDIQNTPPVYILSLGTDVVGVDNDVIYFTAWKFNNYVNLGDVA